MKNLLLLVLLGIGAYFFYLFLLDHPSTSQKTKKVTESIEETIGIRPKKFTKPHCAVTFVSPIPEAKNISSPLLVEVVVKNSPGCIWTVFEAQAGRAVLTTSSGKELGQTTLKAVSDWMTAEPVTYTGSIIYKSSDQQEPFLLKFIEETVRDNDIAEEAYVTVYQK